MTVSIKEKWILPISLAVALTVTGVWGFSQYRMNQQYRIHMENIYQKSFYELVGNVGSVESSLDKLMVSDDGNQHGKLLSEISRQADAAQTDLGQLPVSHVALDKTSKYLNQLSDYSYYLVQKVSDGTPISAEEMKNLKALRENAARLNQDLSELNREAMEKKSGWGQFIRNRNPDFYKVSDDLYTKQFTEIQKTGINYPRLIYDGPFTETSERAGDSALKGAAITQEQAKAIAVSFVGKARVSRVKNTSDSSNGLLDTWGVNIWTREDPKSPAYVAVSKKGGKVVTMISSHTSGSAGLSINEATKRAKKFLDENGYHGMVPTYQQDFDGTSTINFAYAEKGTIVYPDLIKVKIGLDDGKIFGFEAGNYLIAHKARNPGQPKLTMEEARKRVHPNLKITSSRTAIIPTESKSERFCYEFKGEYGGNRFIVYLDANTGEEADILQIIDTKNGSLTM